MFSMKSAVIGKWAAILDHSRYHSPLTNSAYRTRCFKNKEIHEFFLYENNCHVNVPVFRGFCEFTVGGVISIGDSCYSGQETVGKIACFDKNYTPNYYRIMLEADTFKSNIKSMLFLGGEFIIF